jgi:chemotaxis methyl-accepting protein methylase
VGLRPRKLFNMDVLLSPGYRCRHVVFTAAAPRSPLNLGRVATALAAPSGDSGSDARLPTDEDAFATWLLSRAGLDARSYRRTSLRRRVPACLRALHVKTIADARSLLWRNPALAPVGANALLIGVTSFFRDAAVFGLMSDQLLPALAGSGRRLRVWSAACSDGAELYSVAMLLAELNVLHRCELLGTDCRGEAVSRAAAGVYDAATCRAVPPDLRGRYLQPVDSEVASDRTGNPSNDDELHPPARRVRPLLRDAVTWRAADVLDAPEPGPWDLILCRNVAMYLRPATAERLWRGLAASLRPGGLLVVGKAERPAGAAAGRLAPVGPCVYRRGEAA